MKILKKDMTQEVLRQYLNYCPTTGYITWKTKHCSKVVVGNRAGSISKRSNHRVLNLFGSVYAEHRIIWMWVYGEFPKHYIDHINHNELDNRIVNLREVTQRENNMNSSKRTDNKTGMTGVWINTANKHKRYMAELSANGKRVYLKAFLTLGEAVTVRKEQEKLYGFHSNHGIDKPL